MLLNIMVKHWDWHKWYLDPNFALAYVNVQRNEMLHFVDTIPAHARTHPSPGEQL